MGSGIDTLMINLRGCFDILQEVTYPLLHCLHLDHVTSLPDAPSPCCLSSYHDSVCGVLLQDLFFVLLEIKLHKNHLET